MKNLITEHQKKWAVCVARAWADEDYKKRLMFDSAKVLKEEEIDVPAGMKIKVVENTQELIYLVLPAAPDSEDGSIENVEERLAAMSCLCLCLLGPIQGIGDLLTGGLTGN
jgi:hypothetical protein